MKKKSVVEKMEDGLVKREVFNGEIWALFQSVQSLLALPQPGKSYYRIKSLIADLGKDYEAINDTRQQLFKKHAAKDDKGNPVETNGMIRPSSENLTEFTKEINELMSIKKEVTYFAINIPPDSLVVWADIEAFLSEECINNLKGVTPGGAEA
jgi:hypothetical protein